MLDGSVIAFTLFGSREKRTSGRIRIFIVLKTDRTSDSNISNMRSS
jgi:hypothetical protein